MVQKKTIGKSAAKSQRILSCQPCRQRKVKCSRTFPCEPCVKARFKCIPTNPPQAGQRPSYQEVVDRVHHYEAILRRHHIEFVPDARMPSSKRNTSSKHAQEMHIANFEHGPAPHISTTAPTTCRASGSDTKSQDFADYSISSMANEIRAREAINRGATDADLFFLGDIGNLSNTSNFHPSPSIALKLWQIYLENVDPLLKVTHTPTLQPRVIEACGRLGNIQEPILEALIFAMYCVAITSLSDEDCILRLGFGKEDLLYKQQSGCRKALVRCGILRTTDRECLTALYLYLLSLQPRTSPLTLSNISAIAVRIAQNMGMHNESELLRRSLLEAELRRRLWWSLIMLDNRMSELAGSKIRSLDATWSCSIPSNLSDFEMSSTSEKWPEAVARCDEASFLVLKCRLRDYSRRSTFVTNYLNSHMRPLFRHNETNISTDLDDLVQLEESIEDQYLKNCDMQHPVHFMTVWTSRMQLAKFRLLEHESRHRQSLQTDASREMTLLHAVTMLECDTMIMTSNLTRKFLWLHQHYFPFQGYLSLFSALRAQPLCKHNANAWRTIGRNCQSWSSVLMENKPFLKAFSNIILHTWRVCQAALENANESPTTPDIVAMMDTFLIRIGQDSHKSDARQDPDTLHAWQCDAELSAVALDLENQDSSQGVDWSGFDDVLLPEILIWNTYQYEYP